MLSIPYKNGIPEDKGKPVDSGRKGKSPERSKEFGVGRDSTFMARCFEADSTFQILMVSGSSSQSDPLFTCLNFVYLLPSN